MRTGGHLQPADTRRLLVDLARAHATNAVGRLTLLAHLHPGRNAYVPPGRLVPPNSALTRAATDAATKVLPTALLNHSHRTYQFGRAIGELEAGRRRRRAPVRRSPAARHRPRPRRRTRRLHPHVRPHCPRRRRTRRPVHRRHRTLQTAITMHHSPRVTLTAGPVAYLLSAGAGVDVVGVRIWQLPAATLAATVRDHPRDGFKKYFTQAMGERSSPRPTRPRPPPPPLRRVHRRHRTRTVRRVKPHPTLISTTIRKGPLP